MVDEIAGSIATKKWNIAKSCDRLVLNMAACLTYAVVLTETVSSTTMELPFLSSINASRRFRAALRRPEGSVFLSVVSRSIPDDRGSGRPVLPD
jgi:hypothetical protein